MNDENYRLEKKIMSLPNLYNNLEISLVILNIEKKRNFRECSATVSEFIDKKKDLGSKWPI